MKGVVIELPPNIANELRNGKEQKNEWEQLLPLPPSTTKNNEAQSPTTNDDDDDDSSSSSLPPPTMPAVNINWNQLLGYIPEPDESHKVAEALWSNDNDDDDALDKLLTSRIARHALCGDEPEDEQCVCIEYPRFMTDPEHPQKLVSTAKRWKAVLKPHDISVVERVLHHVRHCHKTLGWKYAMSQELRSLASTEQSHQERQTWNRKRPQQLQELYAMRETMQSIYDEACRNVEQLEEERMVQAKLAYSQHDNNNNNDDLLDLFPRQEEDDDDYYPDDYLGEYDSSDDSDSSSQHSFSENDASVKAQESATPTLDIPDQEDGSPAVSEVKDDGAPMIPATENPKDEEAWSRGKQEDVFTEHDETPKERTLQDYLTQFTTTELRMAQAASSVLEQKLQRIDELLESLQDEEWAAEEEDKDEVFASTDPKEFGLLDQILAMILGSTDLQPQELFREHMDIVEDWKAYFGRLPPSFSDSGPEKTSVVIPKEDPAELKQTLGIVDNVETDWDSDEEKLPNDTPSSSIPPKVGLRPGGRLILP